MNADPLSGFLPWLLAASLRASLAALVILALQKILSRRLPARWRFGLWTPFVLMLMLPSLPDSPVSVERLWSAFRTPASVPLAANPSVAHKETATPVVAPAADSGSMRKTEAAAGGWSAWQVGGIVWLAGFAGVAGMGLMSHRRQMRRIRRAAVEVSPGLRESMRLAAEAVGLKRLPEILCSSAVESPAVTGLRRSLLLLPPGFPENLSAREATLILRHEALHLKHRDTAWDVLFWLLNAAHWFNPLIWFAFIRLRSDREGARDAGVLAEAGHEDRAAYGGALLRLQLPPGYPLFRTGFVGLVNGGGGMRRRIAGLAGHRRVSKGWHLAGAALALLIQLTVGASAAPKPPKPPKAPAAAAAAAVQVSGNASVDNAKALILDKVTFSNVLLEDVVAYIRRKGKEADAKSATGRKWFDVAFIGTPKSQKTKLSLSMENASAYDVLATAAGMVGLQAGPDGSGDAIRLAAPGNSGFASGSPVAEPDSPAVAKAKRLIVDRAQFSEAKIEDVVSYIRRKSMDADTSEENPEKKGVDFILLGSATPGEGTITLDLGNVSVYELTKAAAEMAGRTVGSSENGEALVISRPGGAASGDPGPAAAPAPGRAKRSAVSALASKLIMDRVQFENATAEQAASYIQGQSARLDPAGRGIKVLVDPGAGKGKPITLDLRQSKVLDVVGAVADVAGFGVEDDGTALKFVARRPGK